MAEIQNTFIRSKMNKDLDDRIVPTGEYRDALNVAISRSEGDDVGALETILGNELYYGEDSYETCIGRFVDQNNKKVYYFVTNYIDSSATGLSNFAPREAYCAIILYNTITNYKTVLVEGQFLNFSARSPITGVNVIEDLLFWTDNRNQPRKININNAVAFPAAPPSTFRSPAQTATPYYTNEDQISVAKYAPWKPISLVNIDEIAIGAIPTESTMTNPSQEFYPNGTSPKPDYDDSWPGDPDYLSDRFIRLSYRFKFDDNEYSLMAPFTQPCFIPNQNGYFISNDYAETYRSTVVSFFENNVTQILANIEFETTAPNIELKIKEVEILYKESDGLVVKVIESVGINDVISGMVANGAKGGNPYVYTYKYISAKPYKVLPEDQIPRVYDKIPTRALAQEVVSNRVVYGNFYTVQSPPKSLDYNIGYGNKIDLLGVSQIEYPNHTLKQNRNYQVGFILADKFGRQSSVILSSNDVGSNVGGEEYGGSTIYVPYKPNGGSSVLDWPGFALRALINAPIPSSNEVSIPGYPGLYKDSKYGADYVVITQGGTGYTNGTYLASVTGGTGSGLTVQVSVNAQRVRDVLIINNGTGYTDGDLVNVIGGNNDSILTLKVSDPNVLGWYSYKVVVRQTEQDYYNVYLPSILNGYPETYVDGSTGLVDVDFEPDVTANIVLYNDNINKIPRDLNEVGPDQKQYRSSVRLFGRVTPNNGSNVYQRTSTQYYPSVIGDSVTSISTLVDSNYNGTTLGTKQTLEENLIDPNDPLSNVAYTAVSDFTLEYPEFYQCNTNPLIARISTQAAIGRLNGGGTRSPFYVGLGVYETDPFESLLDIYWETTSSGLISDLNLAILEGGFEGAIRTNGYSFILNERHQPGSNAFAPATQNPPLAQQPFDGIQVINGFGNIMYKDVEFELVRITDESNTLRTDEFVLYDTGAAGTQIDPLSFNIRTASEALGDDSSAYFFYGQNALVRTFNALVRVTYTNPLTSDVTITSITLSDLALNNIKPVSIQELTCPEVLFPGGQQFPDPINLLPALIQQPVVDIKLDTFQFDGNVYFGNGSLCQGDNAQNELSIISSMSPESALRYFIKTYPAAGIPRGKAEVWVKGNAPVTTADPYDLIRLKAVDAGGNSNATSIHVSAIISPQVVPNIQLSPNNVPICYVNENSPYHPSSGGQQRYGIIYTGLSAGQTYETSLVMNYQLSQNGTIGFAQSPCSEPIFTAPAVAPFEYVQYVDVQWDGGVQSGNQVRFNMYLESYPNSSAEFIINQSTYEQIGNIWCGINGGCVPS